MLFSEVPGMKDNSHGYFQFIIIYSRKFHSLIEIHGIFSKLATLFVTTIPFTVSALGSSPYQPPKSELVRGKMDPARAFERPDYSAAEVLYFLNS